MDGALQPNVVFDNFARHEQIKQEWVKTLAEARLKGAQAASIDEHTRQQYLTNVIKARSLQEYENDLRRFYSRRGERENRVKWLEQNAQALGRYKLGHRIPDPLRTGCWSAYRVFLTLLSPKALTMIGTTSVDPSCCEEEHWVGRKTLGTLTDPSIPCPANMDNVLYLMDWQNEHYDTTLVRFGSPPFLVTLQAFDTINEFYAAQIQELETKLKAIRDETYNLWNPQELLKLTSPTGA